MSGPSIKVTRDFYAIRVFINDLLHVHVRTERLLAVHGWWDHPTSYSIEYVMAGGTLLTEYTDREKWAMVLSGVEGVL